MWLTTKLTTSWYDGWPDVGSWTLNRKLVVNQTHNVPPTNPLSIIYGMLQQKLVTRSKHSLVPRLLPVLEGAWCGAHNRRQTFFTGEARRKDSSVKQTWITSYRQARTGQDGKKRKCTSDILCARVFKWCTYHSKSLLPDVMHMMNFTRLSHFSVCIIENLGGAWVRG